MSELTILTKCTAHSKRVAADTFSFRKQVHSALIDILVADLREPYWEGTGTV